MAARPLETRTICGVASPRRALVLMVLAMLSALSPIAAQAEPERLGAKRQWLALDVHHSERTLPSFGLISTPLNWGVQGRYHHDWLHSSTLSGGGSAQLALSHFDRLFWAASLGAGLDGAWRPGHGLFAGFGLRADYARLFTGSNNFEHNGERYAQTTDTGRGVLRLTLAELTLGYSPPGLRQLGLVPAIRYAWHVDLPLYPAEEAQAWSYTQLGVSVLWMFGEAAP